MDNQFTVEIMPDGNVKVTAEGGFSREHHEKADKFLAKLKELMGGDQVEVGKIPRPHLHDPQDVRSGGKGEQRQSL